MALLEQPARAENAFDRNFLARFFVRGGFHAGLFGFCGGSFLGHGHGALGIAAVVQNKLKLPSSRRNRAAKIAAFAAAYRAANFTANPAAIPANISHGGLTRNRSSRKKATAASAAVKISRIAPRA